MSKGKEVITTNLQWCSCFLRDLTLESTSANWSNEGQWNIGSFDGVWTNNDSAHL